MTHLKMKVMPKALLSTLGMGIAATLAIAPIAFAQTTGSNIPTKPQKVEKIEVTGSNIKRVESEGSAPIQIIKREEIERSGKQTVTELLRNLPTNAGGGLNDITGSNSFSSGASTVSLRGLGSAATLVLLNGRRIAPFGPADPNFGQSAATNLDALPLDVIDRIEILKDGASAIYGSEAIAGVVNIILRKDFTGALVSGTISQNKDGEYNTRRASATYGIGDLAADRYNVFFNYERFERETVKVNDVMNYLLYPQLRDAPSFALYRRNTSSFAGSYLRGVYNANGSAVAQAFLPAANQPGAANCAPGAIKDAGNICRFDVVNQQDIVPKSNRDNFFTRGTLDINANLSAFAELSFNRAKTLYRGNPQVYGDFGIWYSSTKGQLVNLQEFLPVGHPNNPFTTPIIYRHRFTEVGNTDRLVKSEATRFAGGFKGTNKGIDWETGLLFSGNENTNTSFNQIRATVLSNAVRAGTYNFFSPNSGAVKPSDIRIDTVDKAKSSFMIVDAKASTELMQMNAGALGLAAGVEFRKEKRTASPDEEKLKGEVVGFGAAFADGKRDVKSLFAELSIPLHKSLEAQVALRTDSYSDYGRSTTPKVGIKWKATSDVALRASYAKGFRAPSLTEISRSSVTAFYGGITDPKRCLTGVEPSCSQTVAALLENAERLDPETSKSYNIGMIWDIAKDVSFTVDYYDIRRKNEINLLDPDLILANEDATTGIYRGRVVRGAVLPGETVGALQAIRNFFFNGGETIVKGVDFDLRWNHNLGAYGKLSTTTSGTYYKNFLQSAAGEPLIEYGSAGFPRFRGTAGAAWEYRDVTVGLTGIYNHSYDTARDPTVPCRSQTFGSAGNGNLPCRVGSNATANASVRYTGIKDLSLSLLVSNIFDKKPPLDPLARPLNFTYHPFQSIVYTVNAQYTFK